MSFMASVCSLKLNIIPPNMKFLLKLYREFRFHFFSFIPGQDVVTLAMTRRMWQEAELYCLLPPLLVWSHRLSRPLYGIPLQYSCLVNPMDGGAWWAAVHGVRSQTRLSDFNFTFHFHALEKEMATHSSVLAWRIPGTGKPGGLPSLGSHRVGHDWSNLPVLTS